MDTLQVISSIAIAELAVISGLLGYLIGTVRRTDVVPPAEVWLPPMDYSDPGSDGQVVKSDDDVLPLRRRQEAPESPQWSEDTVARGVADMQAAYAAAGMTVSEREIREEVELMLNSENGEID